MVALSGSVETVISGFSFVAAAAACSACSVIPTLVFDSDIIQTRDSSARLGGFEKQKAAADASAAQARQERAGHGRGQVSV